MSKRRLKLALLATMATGAIGSIAVPGVYAVFTAETRNTQASAASGTLTMDLTVGAGSPCYSYTGPASPGNVNTSCNALLTFNAASELYPGEPKTTTVTVRNDGSLPASDLLVFMPGGCTPANTADWPYTPNTGDPCAAGGMQFYIEETTPGSQKCWFPSGAAPCAFTANLSSFAARTTLATALDLGPGPAAQGTRTFTIGLQVPNTSNNTYQGRAATFALNFHLNS